MKDRAATTYRISLSRFSLIRWYSEQGCSRHNIFLRVTIEDFFIMRKDCSSQMMMAVEKDPLRALPWYQCFTRVRVGPASCATLMNCYSNMNLVS